MFIIRSRLGAIAPLATVLAGLAAGLLVAGALGSASASDGMTTGAEVGDSWQRGANVTAFLPTAYAEAPSRRAMLTARAAGTEIVALTPTSCMETADSSQVMPDVSDGTFRGEIDPADPGAWFDSYGELLDRYAGLDA